MAAEMVRLYKGRLQGAVLAVEALKALAQTRAVVAQTAARAVTELLSAGDVEALLAVWAPLWVSAGWALLLRAVWATEAIFALAAIDLLGIPSVGVDLAGIRRELLDGLASTVVGATVRAGRAVAGAALEAWQALASTGRAVADTGVRALSLQMGDVISEWDISPCLGVRARAEGAVWANPSWDDVALAVLSTVLAAIASALVVVRAAAVAGARVWARGGSSRDERHSDGGSQDEAHILHQENTISNTCKRIVLVNEANSSLRGCMGEVRMVSRCATDMIQAEDQPLEPSMFRYGATLMPCTR